MIARGEDFDAKNGIWSALSAIIPSEAKRWRQDGKPMTRDGKHFARFVTYIEANTVRERLDAVVPGEWDLTLEALPIREIIGEGGKLVPNEPDTAYAFKARLQVMGVIREDVGYGKDWKQAASDAFKRVAVRFGIGHELYDVEQNWVQLDGDGKYAKPVEDPQTAYERRYGGKGAAAPAKAARPVVQHSESALEMMRDDEDANLHPAAPVEDDPAAVSCPKCGGRTWDNRLTKKNPKAPDYACRDRACGGVIWPSKKPRREPEDDDDEIPF